MSCPLPTFTQKNYKTTYFHIFRFLILENALNILLFTVYYCFILDIVVDLWG